MSTLLTLLYPWVSLLSIILSTITINIVSTTPTYNNNIPRLSAFLRDSKTEPQTLSQDFQIFFFNQTLDHFNYGPESYAIFKQKYVINSKYWGGPNVFSPIFVYFGAESPLDDGQITYSAGIINDNAAHFKALLIYIEHRYYGESIPFGTFDEVMNSVTIRGYFNSAQALADYAEIIVYVKEEFAAQESPVIVFGGSYGGMLASWFRLKYPHIALGALASSAPILNFDGISPENTFPVGVTKDFKEASESCYQAIRNSWFEIDNVASQQNGLSILSQRFKTCSPLGYSYELKNYLEDMYSKAAQYDGPPTYPVTQICSGIDGAPEGTDILGRIFAGVIARIGNTTCYINDIGNPTSQTSGDTNGPQTTDETGVGWGWQVCSEMVTPMGQGSDDTMFQPRPFNATNFINDCKSKYGVTPRPHWVTTYYGGHDIKLVLQRFASNIIFSNGLRDPFSGAGILEDISDTILAIYTAEGSHCLDMVLAQQSDPYWLVNQRQIEIQTIEGWIRKYVADVNAFRK
ncbi:uncharacterized protein LOC132309028 [Cornus florida]|uniref:uncharacterized protein LOC132309028 n=1 Tax=Cornus florida TaxID=4283 RepID=UPI00289D5215|nr:uncharacterized protein LOC132309028 [Cornus florida]